MSDKDHTGGKADDRWRQVSLFARFWPFYVTCVPIGVFGLILTAVRHTVQGVVFMSCWTAVALSAAIVGWRQTHKVGGSRTT